MADLVVRGKQKTGWPQFGSVSVHALDGSSSSEFLVPLGGKGFLGASIQFQQRGTAPGWFLEAVPMVPVLLSVLSGVAPANQTKERAKAKNS